MPLMATDKEAESPVARLVSIRARTRVCGVVEADTCKCG
jgi:hypothetical protein